MTDAFQQLLDDTAGRKLTLLSGQPLQREPKKRKPAKPKGEIDTSWHERYRNAHYEWDKAAHPALHKDGHYIKPTMPDTRTHNGLLTFCQNYLKYVGGVGTYTPTQGVPIPGTNKMRPSPGKGKQDVDCTYKGVNFKIEGKVGRDDQRDDQKKYQNRIEAAGGHYFVLRDPHLLFAIIDYIDQYGTLKEFKINRDANDPNGLRG